MREHRAVLYTANGRVTQTRLRVCLVHNSMEFANQKGLYVCVNVISIFHVLFCLARKIRLDTKIGFEFRLSVLHRLQYIRSPIMYHYILSKNQPKLMHPAHPSSLGLDHRE